MPSLRKLLDELSLALQFPSAVLPKATHVSVRHANSPVAGMAHAPSLILATPNASAGYAATMTVRTAAAERKCGRNGIRQIDGEKGHAEQCSKKLFHLKASLGVSEKVGDQQRTTDHPNLPLDDQSPA